MRAIERLGLLTDGRRADALALLRNQRGADGEWRVSGRRSWRRATEVVDWGDAHEVVTPAARAMRL